MSEETKNPIVLTLEKVADNLLERQKKNSETARRISTEIRNLRETLGKCNHRGLALGEALDIIYEERHKIINNKE